MSGPSWPYKIGRRLLLIVLISGFSGVGKAADETPRHVRYVVGISPFLDPAAE